MYVRTCTPLRYWWHTWTMRILIFSCCALAKATRQAPLSATMCAIAVAWSPLDSSECKRDKSSDCWGGQGGRGPLDNSTCNWVPYIHIVKERDREVTPRTEYTSKVYSVSMELGNTVSVWCPSQCLNSTLVSWQLHIRSRQCSFPLLPLVYFYYCHPLGSFDLFWHSAVIGLDLVQHHSWSGVGFDLMCMLCLECMYSEIAPCTVARRYIRMYVTLQNISQDLHMNIHNNKVEEWSNTRHQASLQSYVEATATFSNMARQKDNAIEDIDMKWEQVRIHKQNRSMHSNCC